MEKYPILSDRGLSGYKGDEGSQGIKRKEVLAGKWYERQHNKTIRVSAQGSFRNPEVEKQAFVYLSSRSRSLKILKEEDHGVPNDLIPKELSPLVFLILFM